MVPLLKEEGPSYKPVPASTGYSLSEKLVNEAKIDPSAHFGVRIHISRNVLMLAKTKPHSSPLDMVREILGKPYCSGKRYLIYNGDCLQALEQLPSSVFDLTVTSPPYNIGKEYETNLPVPEFISWCEKWIGLIHRTTKPAGAFWLNLGYVPLPGRAKAIPLPYLLWDRIPFFMMQEVVWNYGAGVAAKRSLSPRNEKLVWYVKDAESYTFNLDSIRDPDVKYPNQKKNGKLRCNPLGKNPSDVWQIPKVTSGEKRASKERAPHPAQFPLALVDRVVKGFSNEEELVLDPFMGSGTTAESAIRNNRYVVGFELRKDYCKYIAQRLKDAENDIEFSLF